MGLVEGWNAVENARMNREKLRQETATHNATMAQAGIDPNTGAIVKGGATDANMQNTQKQLQLLQQQLQRQQNVIDANDSAFYVKEAITTGDFTKIQGFFEKNPRVAKIWEQQGVSRVDNINFDKDQQLLLSKGFTPEQIANTEARSKISKALFKVQDRSGNWNIASAENIFKQTNLQSRIASSEWETINQTFRDAKTALTPIKDPDDPLTEFTMAYKKLYGEDAKPEEIMKAYEDREAKKKEQKGFEPFSIQEAKFVAELETKIAKGTATQAEKAQLDAYKRNEAGAGYKTNVAMKGDLGKFEQKYNINLTTDDVSKIPQAAQGELTRLVRDIESTPAGKEVTRLVSKNIEGGLGAVMTTVAKLSTLASQEKVETGLVRSQLDKVKEYIPESWLSVDDKDLANSEFRKAFLSVSSTILKLQSGLTVTDAERADFQNSMGSLNRNVKTNMAGIKLKFDELNANYQLIRQLEPTLYNIKYAKSAAIMNELSKGLDKFIAPTGKGERKSSTSGSSATAPASNIVYGPNGKRLIAPPPLIREGQQSGSSIPNAPSKQRRPLSDFKVK
jgi:hypothetical protein